MEPHLRVKKIVNLWHKVLFLPKKVLIYIEKISEIKKIK